MAFIRDRTNLFISYRQSYTHRPPPSYDFTDELDTPLNHDHAKPLLNDEAVEMEEMPPQWLSVTTQLDAAVQKIQTDINELKPLQRKNALPGFDDRSTTEKQIETKTVAITKGLHRCQELVKSFGVVAESQPTVHLAQMARNIQISMAAKLQDCSTSFRQMQSTYLKSLQQDELGDLPGMLSAHTDLEDDIALSEMTLQRSRLTQSQSWEEEEVSKREAGITKIADTILEVADIFRDLQTMVIDQGALVDRIDYNVENTLVDVRGASKQLVEGERYQKRTQKCKVIMLLVLIVVALVLILIFKPRHQTVYVEPVSGGNNNSNGGNSGNGNNNDNSNIDNSNAVNENR